MPPDSRAARDGYLDALPPEEQAIVLRQAERNGPLPTDADWLVARSSQQAADRMEAAVERFESAVSSNMPAPVVLDHKSVVAALMLELRPQLHEMMMHSLADAAKYRVGMVLGSIVAIVLVFFLLCGAYVTGAHAHGSYQFSVTAKAPH